MCVIEINPQPHQARAENRDANLRNDDGLCFDASLTPYGADEKLIIESLESRLLSYFQPLKGRKLSGICCLSSVSVDGNPFGRIGCNVQHGKRDKST